MGKRAGQRGPRVSLVTRRWTLPSDAGKPGQQVSVRYATSREVGRGKKQQSNQLLHKEMQTHIYIYNTTSAQNAHMHTLHSLVLNKTNMQVILTTRQMMQS